MVPTCDCGPLNLDHIVGSHSDGLPIWRLYCISFGTASSDLCPAISAFGRRISTSYVDLSSLAAYTACHLIPLNKNPGVCPIGVGEVLRRIVGKPVMKVARQDLQHAAGSSQLCASQIGGCKAAVHAMRNIFASASVDGVLLVDATNAFNELNRQVTFHNVEVICSDLSCICPYLNQNIPLCSFSLYWRSDHLF